jgi:hypothetical protein
MIQLIVMTSYYHNNSGHVKFFYGDENRHAETLQDDGR